MHACEPGYKASLASPDPHTHTGKGSGMDPIALRVAMECNFYVTVMYKHAICK